MIKYIQDTIIRSRLTLTYRMHIDGKPVDEKLPFRLLVLGDFSGQPIAGRPALSERKVIRIPNGTKYEDAFADAELDVSVRFDEAMKDGVAVPTSDGGKSNDALKPLVAWIQGDFTGDVSGDVDAALNAGATTVAVKGKVTIEGKRRTASHFDQSNGLGDFSGKLDFSAPVDISSAVDDKGSLKTPLPALTAPTFTGSALDKDVTLTGRIKGDLAGEVLTKMEVTLSDVKFATKADGGNIVTGKVKGKAMIKLAFPIRSVDSFSPDSIGQYVPEIRRLRVIESLLLDLRATLLTSPPLQQALRKLPLTLDNLKALRDAFVKRYPYLKIDVDPAVTKDTKVDPLGGLDQLQKLLVQPLFPKKDVDDWVKNLAPKTDALTIEKSSLVLVSGEPTTRVFSLQDRNQDVAELDRFVNQLAAFFANLSAADADLKELATVTNLADQITVLQTLIEGRVNKHLTDVLDSEPFRTLEKNWRGLAELCGEVSDDLVEIDVLDVRKDELASDLADHDVDIMTSAFFKKLYHDEYDRYGGKPYGVMIGLYDFDGTNSDDLGWIQTMSKVSNLAHCPFIAAANAGFFGCKTAAELEAIPDLDKVMSHPRYGKWDVFRETDGAGYVGLCLPGYLLREPWGEVEGEPGNLQVKYRELKSFVEEKLLAVDVSSKDEAVAAALEPAFADRDRGDAFRYLFGNPAILFARNLVRSFQLTGWCQRIRGQYGGGLIEGLTVHTIDRKGRTEIQPPVEVSVPDFRELQFANHGFIPLVWRKDATDATFFSARSTKKAIEFKDEIDTQNADLVCNLAYTFSITRIAHYIKLLARPYIGTSADASYLQNLIETWLKGYVTTTVNPDDLTLQQYPFRAISVTVKPKPGPLGWYTSVVSVLPHVQFEGMDVELRLEAALGGAK